MSEESPLGDERTDRDNGQVVTERPQVGPATSNEQESPEPDLVPDDPGPMPQNHPMERHPTFGHSPPPKERVRSDHPMWGFLYRPEWWVRENCA